MLAIRNKESHNTDGKFSSEKIDFFKILRCDEMRFLI